MKCLKDNKIYDLEKGYQNLEIFDHFSILFKHTLVIMARVFIEVEIAILLFLELNRVYAKYYMY